MSKYPIRETDLAEVAGISRNSFKKLRESVLIEEEDWGREKNAIVLTEEAALALLAGLQVSSPANLLERLLGATEPKKTAIPSPVWNFPLQLDYTPAAGDQRSEAGDQGSVVKKTADGRIVAEVVKLPLNYRFMDAVLGDGERIRVRVRNSGMFHLKQLIPVKKTRTAVYELDAPSPRKRGRIPGFVPPKKQGVTSALHQRYTSVTESLQG